MTIKIRPHAKERMQERGAKEEEVIKEVRPVEKSGFARRIFSRKSI